MKATLIPIIRLQVASPQKSIIPATELAECVMGSAELHTAQLEADALKHDAQALISDAQRAVETIQQQAYLDSQADAAEGVEAARTHVIEETLDWLVAEGQLELAIASRLEERIRILAAQALLEFSGKQDHTELLVRRLARKIPETIRHGQLQLRVSSSRLASVQAAFEGEPHIQVSTDDTLAEAHAVLENNLVRLQIDLDRHLNLLTERLKQPTQPSFPPHEQTTVKKDTPALYHPEVQSNGTYH